MRKARGLLPFPVYSIDHLILFLRDFAVPQLDKGIAIMIENYYVSQKSKLLMGFDKEVKNLKNVLAGY